MFDFKSMPQQGAFQHHFELVSQDRVSILDNDFTYLGTAAITPFGELTECDELMNLSLFEDWQLFKQRPEYHMIIWPQDDIITFDFEDYEKLLAGSIFMKATRNHKNPDDMIPTVTRCLDWLRTTDFYTCPASTQYHDSVPGGLLQHSLKVTLQAINLQASYPFEDVNIEDAIFVALVHDWCKIGLYSPYMKNVKNDVTGQWEQVQAYKYIEDRTICLGHGTSSMYMVMKFFHITVDVAAAIRWHMGRWNVVDSEINELQQANRNYPLVHLIQFADQLSITNYI